MSERICLLLDAIDLELDQGTTPGYAPGVNVWRVIFVEPTYKYYWEGPKPWYSRFLAKGFHHVFCTRRVGDVHVLVEWTYGLFNVELDVDDSSMTAVAELSQLFDGTVLEVPQRTQPETRTMRFPLLSCVQSTQHCLGVYKPFIVTPKQLCDYLISRPDTRVVKKGSHFGNL